MNKSEKLNALKNRCLACQKCELAKTRTNVVFADGNPDARILLIGEAPGKDEDLSGLPFVGRAGKLLNQFLEEAGISRENDIYICNTIKCRPPENRLPKPKEKELCLPYLLEQIDIVRPKVVVLCGATAAQTFLTAKEKISTLRGKWFDCIENAKTTVIFHPSYLLRNHSMEPSSPRQLTHIDLVNIINVQKD